MTNELEQLRVSLQQMNEQRRRHAYNGIDPNTPEMMRVPDPLTTTRAIIDHIEKKRKPENPTRQFKGIIKFNQAKKRILASRPI